MEQKVLVAEDDAILREIMLGKLGGAGYKAIGADDGQKAIDVIRSERPALVLLDILLPTKSGLDVLKELRADTSLQNIPVIAISNSDDAAAISEAKGLGVRDFLIKAIFDSSDVLAKVKQILSSAAPAQSAAVAEKTDNGRGKTILIVEDDKFLRDIAAGKLEAEGFKLATAESGTDAMAYLENNAPPDIIVLDLLLPGLSGFEVLEKLKANPKLSNIPVVVLSNLGQEEDIEKAKKLGARDYLVKAHFSFAEIIKKIREIVG